MGREEEAHEASSPMDRSTTDFRDGRGTVFPTTFTEVSRKKWIALGLSVFLIIVLLIAVIILATSQAPEVPLQPPCPKENSSSPGSVDALQSGKNDDEPGGPSIGASKDRNVPEVDVISTTPQTTTKKSTTADFWDFGDFPSDDEKEYGSLSDYADSIIMPTQSPTTMEPSVTESTSMDSLNNIFSEDDEEPRIVHIHDQSSDPLNIIEARGFPQKKANDHEDFEEVAAINDKHDVSSDELADLLALTTLMSKEEQKNAIIEKYGNSSRLLEKLEDLLAGQLSIDAEPSDSVQYAAQTLQTKDLHTPDDDHEHHGTTSEQRQYTAHVMEAFIKFVSPNLGQNNASLTVGGFYEMVNALVDILKEINDDKSENNSPDSLQEYLNFMETLRKDIEMLNKNQMTMDIRSFLNMSAIEKVNRLWADYVSDSNSIVFAKIQQALKESGIENLNSSLTIKQFRLAKKQMYQDKFEKSIQTGQFENPTTGECDPQTEMACDDGKGCYSIGKKCDRFIDCVYDRSDEKNCSCRLYLDQNRICDGYPDCPDGSDEIGCFCKPTEHYCGDLNECIDSQLRCDNVIDCKNSNDEMNCFALRSRPIKDVDRRQFPRQEVEGFLHLQKGYDWYLMAFDIKDDNDRSMYSELFKELAMEACASTITRGQQDATYELVDLDQDAAQVAHLMANFEPDVTLNRFYQSVGRFAFTIKPAFPRTSKGLRVNCGQPQCGQAVNDGNDPFGIFNQGHNYKRPSNTAAADLRIVGGMDARPTKWPFSLSLHRNGYFKCGATIIDSQWIVTAGHCVNDFVTRNDYFEVRGGIYRQKSSVSTEEIRKLESIYIHPDYNDMETLHDIAIAKLDRPFDMDSFSAAVCLPDVTEDEVTQVPKSGDTCLAVGWGLLEDDYQRDVADTLQEVKVPIKEECQKNNANASMYICGGFDEGGKDTCQGDSGGALYCQDLSQSEESWYLAGVISHGKGCALPNESSFYTRVSFYKDWINQVISGNYIEMRGLKSQEIKPRAYCPGGVSCDHGRCIGELYLCDFHNDCFDGEDEAHCHPKVVGGKIVYEYIGYTPVPPTTPTTIAPTTTKGYYSVHAMKYGHHKDCSAGSFICKNVRQCISSELRCDLKPDCIDGTDEQDCSCKDYFSVHAPDRLCDGYPDCYDFSDELGCNRCNGSSTFYCHLSKTCIDKSQVCDEKNDCHFQEDERYCMALTKNDQLNMDVSGKPYVHSQGYIAVNYKGNWRFICVGQWHSNTSDTICKYLGYVSSNNYQLTSNTVYPHLQLGHLPIDHVPHRMYRRSPDSEEGALISGRQASCQFVSLSCKSQRTCGRLPLYSSMGQETPTFGPGVTPWKAEIYVEGVHTCGATLVSPRWLLTHSSCAQAIIPESSSVPEKYAVARLGAYRDTPELNFLSGHEQVVRIARSLIIPGSQIALFKLETEVELTEHVHTICLPSSDWVPTNTSCFIHGRHAGVFNHAIETSVVGKCNETETSFDICAKQKNPSGECLDHWSGSLVCPDFSGSLYAVGIYHSGPCQGESNIPESFISIVSDTARQNILDLVQANAGQDDLGQDNCNLENGGQLRCPLGGCLNSSQVCDGIPQCEDASDEKSDFCQSRIEMCEQVNATHCTCALDDMMCDNLMCLDKSKFCDGVNDCGDNSDEPANCENDCAIGLETLNPSKICDANIDCIGEHDLANDESVERCCFTENDTLNNYRCVLGHQPGNVSISNECIPRKCVCDWDTNPGECSSCLNGADEVDCMSIHGQKKYGSGLHLPALDPFGRTKTQSDGYVYFTAHGQEYLYCASPKIFTQDRLQFIGQALCKHEHFSSLQDIKLINPFARTKINPAAILSSDEQDEFDHCKIIFISCQVTNLIIHQFQ